MTYARKAKASQIGYKRGRKSTTVDSRPPSDAYRAGCDRMGWAFAPVHQFCPQCGYTPGWCSCHRGQAVEQPQQENNG